MPTRAVSLLLTLAWAAAAGAQSYEAVLSGNDVAGCFVLAFRSRVLEWVNPDDVEYDTPVEAVAGDERGRVYAITHDRPYQLMRITSSGERTPFSSGPGFGSALAVADDGRVYVLGSHDGAQKIDRFSASGVLEATYPLARLPFIRGFDVGPDGCTILYARGSTIARVDGCTGAPLPDFATVPDPTDLEVQPDGQVVVATSSAVLLYSASGTLVRTVTTAAAYGFTRHSIDQVSVRNGVLWMTPNAPCSDGGHLLRVSFADGTELSRRALHGVNEANALVVSPGALTSVPTAGEVALTLLAFALASAGALALRLR